MIDKPIIPRERLPNSQIHQPNSHISQPTMDDNMPLSFYENIDRKNWTVEIIQRSLHISNDTYASICTVMEKEMRSHEVLGLLLKQPVVKKKLQPIFTYIIQCFPAISPVPGGRSASQQLHRSATTICDGRELDQCLLSI